MHLKPKVQAILILLISFFFIIIIEISWIKLLKELFPSKNSNRSSVTCILVYMIETFNSKFIF